MRGKIRLKVIYFIVRYSFSFITIVGDIAYLLVSETKRKK
jgi:hypothetical protein